jgi:hypothetical protein
MASFNGSKQMRTRRKSTNQADHHRPLVWPSWRKCGTSQSQPARTSKQHLSRTCMPLTLTTLCSWVEGLPTLYKKHGLNVLECHHISPENRHRQLWAHSNLLGFEDLTRNSMVVGTEKEAELRKFMNILVEENAQGICCDTPWICVIGQKRE